MVVPRFFVDRADRRAPAAIDRSVRM